MRKAVPMHPEKAKNILEEYRKSGYKAKIALVNAGYKPSTAKAKSKEILDRAMRSSLVDDIGKVVKSNDSPRHKILELLGISANDVFFEYMKIVLQDKDLSNKLKALQPLLATQGIKWNEENTIVNPTLNLTVKSNSQDVIDRVKNTDIAYSTPDVVNDSQEIEGAQLEPSNDNDDMSIDDSLKTDDEGLKTHDESGASEGGGWGGVDFSFIGVKEGTSPAPKISEKVPLDTSKEILSNNTETSQISIGDSNKIVENSVGDSNKI